MVLHTTTNINSEFEGDNCHYIRDFKKAVCWYNKALVENPDKVDLLIKKGNTLVMVHKYAKAYECYTKAFIHADKYDLIDSFVEKYYAPVEGDVLNLLNRLRLYNILITLDGLNLFLKKEREARDIYHRVKEWQDFRTILQQKYQLPIEEYIYLFLLRFGDSFYKHFVRFYCYISSEKAFNITKRQFADILLDQKKRIEHEQFERFLQTGGKQGSIDHLKGTKFEDYLAIFFENREYFVRRTPYSNDYGADLIISKFGESTSVQIKCKKGVIGLKAVQEVFSAQKYYNTNKALVVVTTSFTKNAIKLAKKNDVELWNGRILLQKISNPWS